MTETRSTEPIVPESEDNREICFEQGKPCVFQPDAEPGIMVTEWPNGVIDRWWPETDTRTRQWPDGTTGTAPAERPLGFPAPAADNGPDRGRRVPKLIIVIGANGAGKSTWCRRDGDQLPEHFYNADAIADGLGGWNSPTNQRAARKLVDDRIERHLARNDDFGFESTYSGRSRPAIIECARGLGLRNHRDIPRHPTTGDQHPAGSSSRRDTHRARRPASRDPQTMDSVSRERRTHRARDRPHPHARQQRPDNARRHPDREG